MAVEKATPKKVTAFRKAPAQLWRVAREVMVGVLVGVIRHLMSQFGLP